MTPTATLAALLKINNRPLKYDARKNTKALQNIREPLVLLLQPKGKEVNGAAQRIASHSTGIAPAGLAMHLAQWRLSLIKWKCFSLTPMATV